MAKRKPQCRHGRLRLHGPHPFERFLQAAASSIFLTSRCSKRSARAMPSEPKTFAENWGYESVETDWRTLIDRARHRPDRYRQPQRYARRDRDRRGESRQDGAVREAAGPQRRRSARRWWTRSKRRSVPNMVWYNYRRVPARDAAEATDRRGPLRPDLPLPREVSAGLDHLAATCRRAAKGCGGWMLAVAGSGVTGDLLAHTIDTALWLNGPIAEVTAMTETFIKERKHSLTGQSGAGQDRRRQRISVPL